jgi:hypothetical protein
MKKNTVFKTGEEDTTVVINIVNPRTISISPTRKEYEIRDEESGKLIGLKYCEDVKILEGDTITVGDQKYKIHGFKKHATQKGKGINYHLSTNTKLTKTFNFIMPFLGYTKGHFRYNRDFINAFIGTQMYADYGNSIYLLYRFNGTKEFMEFEQEMCGHPWFSEQIDTDQYHVLFKFDIPDAYKEEIDLILDGKYSRLSVESKERILRFHDSTEHSTLGQILSRSKVRKRKLEAELSAEQHKIDVELPEDAELLDKFSTKEELFMNYFIIENETTRESEAPRRETF